MVGPDKYILIVDDEEGIRESFKLILDSRYRIQLASDAQSAYEAIRSEMPALVFLDIKMPEINGIEALKQIKQIAPSLPVIIVTGYQSVEAAKEVVSAGASNYIVKPFDTDDILNAVQKFF